MESSQQNIAVACCYFNPAAFQRRRENYLAFADRLRQQGIEPWTAELVLDGDEPLPDSPQLIRIQGRRPDHCLWQKERLLNLLISQLPSHIASVVCADVDLLWHDDHWLWAVSDALREHPVVQPFRRVFRLDRTGGRGESIPSLGWARIRKLPHAGPSQATCGYAWAARREIWERYGWFDAMVSGAGDCSFAGACLGRLNYNNRSILLPRWMAIKHRAWHDAVFAAVRGQIGAIESDVDHLWHGDEQHRGYIERHKTLVGHGLKANALTTDVETGIWRWADRSSRFARTMISYFKKRREDG